MNNWTPPPGGPQMPGAGLNPHAPVKPPGGLHTWAAHPVGPHATGPDTAGLQPLGPLYSPSPGAPVGPPDPKRRKALWVTLAAGAVVVVTVAVVLFLTLAGEDPVTVGPPLPGMRSRDIWRRWRVVMPRRRCPTGWTSRPVNSS